MLLTRRQKRLLPHILLLSLPILLLIIRLAWGAYADHHLTQTRASLKSQGFRIYPEDFSPKSVTTESKAAALILRAANSLTLTREQTAVIDGENYAGSLSYIPWTPVDFALIRQAVATNPSAFDDLLLASREPLQSFPKPFSANLSLYKVRGLANFFFAAALAAHADNKPLETLANFQRVLVIAENLTPQADEFSPGLALALNSFAANGITRIHNQLHIPTNHPARPLAHQLITSLLNDEPFNNQLTAAVSFQSQSYANDPNLTAPFFRTWPIRPSHTLFTARYMQNECAILSATRSQPWLTVAPLLKKPVDKKANLLDIVTLHDAETESFARTIQLSLRSTVDCRAAATLLAIALYRSDHADKNPASLSDLLPAYLPALPLDPFAPTPQPLRYRPTPAPIVWSVGEDGIDDNASSEPQKPLAQRGRLWLEKDAVYGPSRITAPPPPPSPDEDNPPPPASPPPPTSLP